MIGAVTSGTALATVMIAVWAGVSVFRPDAEGIRGPWWSLWVPMAVWTAVTLGHVGRVPLGIWVALIGLGLGIDHHSSRRVRALGAGVVVVAVAWLTWVGTPTWEHEVWALFWLSLMSAATASRPGLSRNRVCAILVAAVVASVPFSSRPLAAGVATIVAGGWLALYLRFWLQQQAMLARRRYQAEHDALTGALTRWGAEAWRLEHIRAGARGLVMAIDIDEFKWFNDTYGHGAGDRVLEQFATRIHMAVGERGVLVRTGGDEFQVLIPGLAETESFRFAEQLYRAGTSDPFAVAGRRFRLGVSMGAAWGPLFNETVEEADRALLDAKQSGKNRLQIADGRVRALHPLAPPASENLGWLANTAEVLWSTWDQPAALLTREGQLLYGNAGFTQQLAESIPRLVTTVLQDAQSWVSNTPWRGLVAWPRTVGAVAWAQETVVPVRMGEQPVGYWLTVEKTHSDQPRRQQVTFLQHVQIHTVFQPLIDLHTRRTIGYEALSRPTLEGIPWEPGQMFGLAEQAGQVVSLDFRCLEALESALRAIAWPPKMTLFVNVAPETAISQEFARLCKTWGEQWPSTPWVWEMAERGNREMAAQAMNDPDLLGSVWALDDFGNGDADIWRLLSAHWTWIKLDRSVVSRLRAEPRVAQWVAFLVNWVHSQGRRVIAEGVETADEEEAVRALDIDVGQGYRWGHPSPWHLLPTEDLG